jgi:cytochrome c oxidase cbb3-type subunit 2
MPGYPWLEKTSVDGATIQRHMRALSKVGVPYTEDDIATAPEAVKGKNESEALIAYLQGLGTALK